VAGGPPVDGLEVVQTDVTIDAASAPLAQLRFYRQRP
jgi:hypothetical protein